MPVRQSGRRLPQMNKEKMKDTLMQLKSKETIGKVDYPIDWVHNINILEKPGGSLRICLDPLELNKAIKISNPISTSDEIIRNFIGKKWFSILDLKEYEFKHMKLTGKSSDLCTFQIFLVDEV